MFIFVDIAVTLAAKDSLSSEIPPSVGTVGERRSSPKTDSKDRPPPVDKGYGNDSLFAYIVKFVVVLKYKVERGNVHFDCFIDVFLVFSSTGLHYSGL